MKHVRTMVACVLGTVMFSVGSVSAQVRLNLATLAPEGSIWMQAFNEARAEIEAATDGAVRIRIFPGGIMGSERDVLAKIRMGQLHGGGFMGTAVGVICPDADALMFPLALRDYEEADRATERMRDLLDANARANGFEVMGWTEVGFNYAYSTRSISNLAELRGTRVWNLDSPMLNVLFSAGNIPTIPANVTDVLPSLQTGALETVFGPPTAAVAVQWHTRIRYYHEMRLSYSIGAVFISEAGWRMVPPEHRDTVRAAFDKHCRLLTEKVRQSDAEALEFMRRQGVQPIPETPGVRAEFEHIAEKALERARGRVFSEEAWNLLQETVTPGRDS